MILVVAEQRDGRLNRVSWESIVGAQQVAQRTGDRVVVAAIGADVQQAALELAAAAVAEVVTVSHAALAAYTADGYTAALEQALAGLAPSLVVLPHTYQTRDFAPKLAARLDRALVTDVTAIKHEGGRTVCVRPMFQGKLVADVVPQGPAPHLVTFRAGAYRPDMVVRGEAPAPVRALAVAVDGAAIRQKPEVPFQIGRAHV